MKNTPLSILACVCLILAAFLGGMYLGRNLSGAEIQISTFGTQPQTQNTTSTSASSPAIAATTADGKININRADLQTLMTLDGIGETYAQRIIDYRNTNGPFKNIKDIMQVEGIGTKRFEAIKDKITVGG